MGDVSRLRDQMTAAAGFGRPQESISAIIGTVHYRLTDERGRIKLDETIENMVTRVGDQWYADRAARILGSTTAVTGVSAANPTVITSTAHGLGAGDPVTVASVGGATQANGSWIISSVTANTLTVPVGATPSAYTSGGTVQGLTLPFVTGMRLGTDSTAAAKTSTGSFIGTYTTGSQHALDSVPASSLAGSSRRITYVCTWAAGEATANGIAEAVLTFESPLSNVAGTAANTLARAVLSPTVNKGASDTLAITWTHDLLGA